MSAVAAPRDPWLLQLVPNGDGTDRRSVTWTLPIRTVSESNQREHWAARARRRRKQRKDVHLLVGIMLRAEGLRAPCTVTLTRIAPRALDSDNLQGACKAIRDGVADALGVDDGDPRIRWEYGQRRGGAKAYGVEIRVERG